MCVLSLCIVRATGVRVAQSFPSTVELRSRLLELSKMLNNVHDKNSANLLNNYSLGTLVQRITEEISRDAATSRVPGLNTTGLMKEIEDNFDERHRHSALVLSVLRLLK